MSPFLDFNTDFIAYGSQHLLVILLTIGLSIGLPSLAKRYFSRHQQVWTGRTLALLIAGWVILYAPLLLYLGKFNHQTDLPLDICNLMGLLLPFLMWNPSRRIFPYFYFWIMAGTTQAVFAPNLFNGFPNFIFIKYWVVHSGMIIYILYVAIVWEFPISWKDMWKAFLGLQIYGVLVFVINKLIGANYVHVIEKPSTASVLDYFGPWPVYLLVMEAILLFLSVMVYLPYRGAREKGKTAP